MKWFIVGANGWIGSKVCHMLESENQIVIKAQSRADDNEKLDLLKILRPLDYMRALRCSEQKYTQST